MGALWWGRRARCCLALINCPSIPSHPPPSHPPPHPLFAAVRIAYPCFGNPTKAANGRILSYPAYGRWRVHNLYVSVWQRSPQYGVLQPYTVQEAYRY